MEIIVASLTFNHERMLLLLLSRLEEEILFLKILNVMLSVGLNIQDSTLQEFKNSSGLIQN